MNNSDCFIKPSLSQSRTSNSILNIYGCIPMLDQFDFVMNYLFNETNRRINGSNHFIKSAISQNCTGNTCCDSGHHHISFMSVSATNDLLVYNSIRH